MMTDRLVLEALSEQDNHFIFELVNTKGWLEFIGNRNVNSAEEAIGYIQRIMENPNVTYWVVKLHEDRKPMGVITLIKRDYLEHHDIGFAFLPHYMNKGYAFEAASELINYVFNELNHTHIQAIVLPSNNVSIRLLEKLGLLAEKKIELNNEQLNVYSISADHFSITKTTKAFFSAFTNKNGKQPNVDLLNKCCFSEVLIIRKTEYETTAYTLQSFIEPRQKILTDGTLTEFEEEETSNTTTIVNTIAQRYSEYTKSGILQGKPFRQEGYKLFQFVKISNEWKICAVIWEDKR